MPNNHHCSTHRATGNDDNSVLPLSPAGYVKNYFVLCRRNGLRGNFLAHERQNSYRYSLRRRRHTAKMNSKSNRSRIRECSDSKGRDRRRYGVAWLWANCIAWLRACRIARLWACRIARLWSCCVGTSCPGS